MAKFQIFTDSTCDLSTEIRKQYHIELVKMNVVKDGQEFFADIDWKQYTSEELYGWVDKGCKLTTTAVPMGQFLEKMRPLLEKGIDILYIACSTKLSGSLGIFNLAKDQLLEEFPDRKMIGIDALNASCGEGILAIEASMRQDEGLSLEETAKWVEDHRTEIFQIVTLETLEYMKRSGRIKASKAFLANIFRKKPIFISDAIGNNYTLGTVTGTKNANNELIKAAQIRLLPEKFDKIFVVHAIAQERAELLKSRLQEIFKKSEIIITPLGPIVGITCGPGTVGIFGVGKEVTIYDGDGKKPTLDYTQL